MEEEVMISGVNTGVNEQPYDKINKLNESLDALAVEVHGVGELSTSNEIEMPSVSSIEMQSDLNTNIVDAEQAAVVKEITDPEEDATNEPSSKGQFILIGILSFVLIVLLVAMVVFTNAL